jgi:hypothetical protein
MSRDCTQCFEPIDGGHYICKYGSTCLCPCILHPHCFEKAKQSVHILLKCQCHPLHIDSFVRVQVAEGTSEDKKIPDSQVVEGTSEDKKNPDSQEHPDDVVYYLDTNGYKRMKRSEMLKLQERDDSQGIPRRRGI